MGASGAISVHVRQDACTHADGVCVCVWMLYVSMLVDLVNVTMWIGTAVFKYGC